MYLLTTTLEKMKTTIDDATLTAYLTGTLDAEGVCIVEAWSAESTDNGELLEEFYRTLFLGGSIAAGRSVDVERSLAEFKRRVRDRRRAGAWGRGRMRLVSRSAAALAAVVLAVAGVVGVGRVNETLSRPTVASTRLGERAQLELPDGSRVWLNSGSRLEYTSSVFPRRRMVEMSGEVYFEVAGNRRAPFVVESRGLRTEVLGTKFNIRANGNEPSVTTTLVEGSVVASASGREVRMSPAQRLVFEVASGRMELSDVTRAAESSIWIDGRLRFEDETLAEIVRRLEAGHNVTITLADRHLAAERFSCEFDATEDVFHILSTLRLTGRMDYRALEDHIEIFAARKQP